jgi:signal transduction histidine kinase
MPCRKPARRRVPHQIDLFAEGPQRSRRCRPAEPAQLQQIILNLCSNAAQAMHGHGRIDVIWQAARIRQRGLAERRELMHGAVKGAFRQSLQVVSCQILDH